MVVNSLKLKPGILSPPSISIINDHNAPTNAFISTWNGMDCISEITNKKGTKKTFNIFV